MTVLDAAGPVLADAIVTAGHTGIVRYVSPDTPRHPRKRLRVDELADYRRRDLDVAVVWETATDEAEKGYNRGRSDAAAALAVMSALGFPPDSPCYFAIDEDTTGPAVADYFAGILSILGLPRVGAYGGINPIGWLFDHDMITYGWQTSAWSRGLWDPRAQAQQYRYDINIGGTLCDVSRITALDWGQWAAAGTTTDRGVIMSQVSSFTPAALAQLADAVANHPIAKLPAGAQTDDGLTLAGGVRGGYYAARYVSNTASGAIQAALAHIDMTLATLSGAEGVEDLAALAESYRAAANKLDELRAQPATPPAPSSATTSITATGGSFAAGTVHGPVTLGG